MDGLDRKILSLIQEDATLPVAVIGERIGLSSTPCWRRIQKLEADGVIRRRVALHHPLPAVPAVTAEDRLAADGGRKHQEFCAVKRQRPGSLRKPLVPADAYADLSPCGLPNRKTGIARGKIKFFLIPMVVRDMGLPVHTEKRPVRVQHGDGIEQPLPVPLEKADRKHGPHLFRNV